VGGQVEIGAGAKIAPVPAYSGKCQSGRSSKWKGMKMADDKQESRRRIVSTPRNPASQGARPGPRSKAIAPLARDARTVGPSRARALQGRAGCNDVGPGLAASLDHLPHQAPAPPPFARVELRRVTYDTSWAGSQGRDPSGTTTSTTPGPFAPDEPLPEPPSLSSPLVRARAGELVAALERMISIDGPEVPDPRRDRQPLVDLLRDRFCPPAPSPREPR